MLHLIKKWKKERKEGQTELERAAKAKEAERERSCSTVEQRIEAGGESAFIVPIHWRRLPLHLCSSSFPMQPNGSNRLLSFPFLFIYFYCYDLISFKIVFLSLYFDCF